MYAHLLAALPLLLSPLGAGLPTATFSDDTFDDTGWETSSFTDSPAVTTVAGQVLVGNPAPARRVTDDFVGAVGVAHIVTRHLFKAADYDPGLEGPIHSVHFSLDYSALQFGQVVRAAMSQGGKFFIAHSASGAYAEPSGPAWETLAATGLEPTQFLEQLPDHSVLPNSHPDFSAAGAPIEFGFQTANSWGGTITFWVDYDNWRVDVNGMPSTSFARLGSPANANAFLPGSTLGPVVGETWDPLVDHSTFLPSATMDVAFYSTFAVNLPTDHGTLLCSEFLNLYSVPAGTPFAFDVPDNALLIGASFCVQAASIDPVAGSTLTNALDVAVGAF